MHKLKELPSGINLKEPDIKYFVNYCLFGGARIYPLDAGVRDPMWPGYCNPSIFWDERDQNFKLILRNVNHVLHGVDKLVKSPSSWGPVLYSIPQEDGNALKTRNYIGISKDPENEPWDFHLIETKPYTPIWQFQGEEDARVVRWNDRLYATGVRRDDNTEGRGRMELMLLNEQTWKEQKRTKVESVNPGTYCEKNWMPINEIPFHYVQQANPTVVVKTDPVSGKTVEVVRKEKLPNLVDNSFDMLRGSSNVIRWNDYWMALVHTCELWYTENGRKYARYCHCFVVWDDDWNIIKVSPLFSFADYNIEFTCGLEYHNGKFYIPLALEDNFSYLLIVDEGTIDNFIFEKVDVKSFENAYHPEYHSHGVPSYMHIFNPEVSEDNKTKLFETAIQYYNSGFFAASYDILVRSIEKYAGKFDVYNERFMAARSIADLGHRDNHEIGMWMHTIMENTSRPEAYIATAMYYYCRGGYMEALYWACMAMDNIDNLPENGGVYFNRDTIVTLYNRCLFQSPYYMNALEYMDEIGEHHNEKNRVL